MDHFDLVVQNQNYKAFLCDASICMSLLPCQESWFSGINVHFKLC